MKGWREFPFKGERKEKQEGEREREREGGRKGGNLFKTARGDLKPFGIGFFLKRSLAESKIVQESPVGNLEGHKARLTRLLLFDTCLRYMYSVYIQICSILYVCMAICELKTSVFITKTMCSGRLRSFFHLKFSDEFLKFFLTFFGVVRHMVDEGN